MRRWASCALSIAILALGLGWTSATGATPDCPDRQTYSVTGTISISSSSAVDDSVDQSRGTSFASGTMTGTWPIYDAAKPATFSGTSSLKTDSERDATQIRNRETYTGQGSSTFTEDDNVATAKITSSYCTVSAEVAFGAMEHSIWTVYDSYGGVSRQDPNDIVQPVGTIHLSYIPVVSGDASGSSSGFTSATGSYSDYDAGVYATTPTAGQRSETESGTPKTSITVSWSFHVTYVDEVPSVSVDSFGIEDQSVRNPSKWATTTRTYEGNNTRVKFNVHNDKSSATGSIVVDDTVSGRVLKTFTSQTFPKGDKGYQFAWDTDGWAWEANQTPKSYRLLRVTVSLDGGLTTTSLLPVTVAPRPVVLVHGLWSSAQAWTGFDARLQSVNPEWRGYAVGDGQFPGTMDTGKMTNPLSEPYTVGENAAEEWTYITRLREGLNARQVDIVAHSLGGIITRYLIHELMPKTGVRVIRTMKMLGTPNGGSACADTYAVPATAPLRTATMARFNVKYWDYLKVPTSLTYSIKYALTCNDLSPGDLVVPKWSSFAMPTNERNRLDMAHTSMTDDPEMFSDRVVPWLARSPESDFPKTLVFSPARRPRADGGDPVQISATGDVSRTSKPSGAIDLQAGESMTVTLVAPPGTRAKLLGPNGKTLALTQVADWPVFTATIPASTSRSSWQLSGPAVSAPSRWTASVMDSDFIMERSIARGQTSYTLTVPLTLDAKPLLKAQVTATTTPVAGGKATQLTLRDDGKAGDAKANDGIYTVKQPMTKGADLNVAVRAVAPDGRERTATLSTVDSF